VDADGIREERAIKISQLSHAVFKRSAACGQQCWNVVLAVSTEIIYELVNIEMVSERGD
jgi:hypothetical protein